MPLEYLEVHWLFWQHNWATYVARGWKFVSWNGEIVTIRKE